MKAHAYSPLAGGTRAAGILLVGMSAWLTSACIGGRARAVTAPTPLEVPEPPPRTVEVREPATPPPVPLPEEPVRNTPERPRPSFQPAEPSRATDAAKPAEPAADAGKPDEASPRPPTTLQTTPTQREEEAERRIRRLLGQATADLGRINYQALSGDGRTQYDMAKRFVDQAEQAVRVRNLVFATNLAEKAATLAAQLAAR
jgi:hypothetical protein